MQSSILTSLIEWVRGFGAFQTRAAQTALVLASQCLQRLCADFDFAAPTTLQVDLTRERLAARGALLCAVERR